MLPKAMMWPMEAGDWPVPRLKLFFEAAGQLDFEDKIFAVVCRPRLDEVGDVAFVVLAHVAKAGGTSARRPFACHP